MNLSKPVLVLRHSGSVGAGHLDHFAKARGLTLHYALLHRGDSLPLNTDEYGALVVLGGEMNVYEEETYPFLRAENEFIRRAVESGLPYLGICLGGQLLAKALGGRVTRNAKSEFGLCHIALNELGQSDPLFAGFSDSFTFCQWHGDTFSELPVGAELLATGDICQHQAFRMGRTAYGVQFHPEATVEIIERWTTEFGKELDTPEQGHRICQNFAAAESECFRHADRLFENFFKIAGIIQNDL